MDRTEETEAGVEDVMDTTGTTGTGVADGVGVRLRARRLAGTETLPLRATLSGDSHRISMRLAEGLVLYPDHRRDVRTGYALDVPDGYVALCVTDGTLAREAGVVVAGGTKIKVPGDDTELVVTMQNLGTMPARLTEGTRLFSVLLCACPLIELDIEDETVDGHGDADE